MRIRQLRLLLLLVSAAAVVGSAGCGFQAATIPEVSPRQISLVASGTQQFSVRELPGGTIWSVNGVPGGNSQVGTISSTGVYTAPLSALASPVTVTATSVAASGLSTSATLQLVNPDPVVSSFSPAIITATAGPIAVAVKGSGFTPQSVVTADGSSLATTYVSASELHATLQMSPAAPRPSIAIAVTTPSPGGGTTKASSLAILSPASATVLASQTLAFSVLDLPGGTSWSVNGIPGGNAQVGTISATGIYTAPLTALAAPVTIAATSVAVPGINTSATVQLLNPQPSVSAINPPILIAGGRTVTLTVNGAGFTPDSTVTTNGNALATTYVSSSGLRAVLQLSAATPAQTSLSIAVTTPQPGGGAAAPILVPVLSPGSAVVMVTGQLQFSLPTLPGGTVWSVNGVHGGASAVGTITDNGLYHAPVVPPVGDVAVTASSVSEPDLSATSTVTVENPVPELTGVDPRVGLVSSAPVTVTVTGHNFAVQSVVKTGGSAVPTTYVSEGELQAVLSQEQVQNHPVTDIYVVTPGPGGGTTSSIPVALLSPGVVKATNHPLVAEYDMTLPPNASMTVEFGADENYGRKTWTRLAPEGGGATSVLVAGMRASSAYHLRARVDLADGTSIDDVDHPFSTRELPQLNFPHVTVSHPSPGLTGGGGVDLISSFGADVGAVVTDADGSIIWYYEAASPFPIRELSNGDFLVNTLFDEREVDLAGNIVRQITANQLNAALTQAGSSLQIAGTHPEPPFHHDAIRLNNGHWILLVAESRDFQDLPGFPGTTTVWADALVDLDENNQPVWVWRALDHLDVNRHPFQFPDWTHANAIVYTSDGNLLLSIRNQSWIIKIDYADGKGSGDVLWHLGFEGDFTLSGEGSTPWFYNQHFPVLLETQGRQFRLALYDNADSQPDASGQACLLANTCLSRGLILNVDEAAHTAEISWQYAPGWFSSWGGSIAVLPDGNVEFDSSTVNGGPSRVIEVTPGPNPQIVWQMDTNTMFYRAYRIPSLYPGVQW